MGTEKKGKTSGTKSTSKSKAKAEEPKAAPKTEERQVKSEDLIDEIKKLVREGNVQRIIVKNKEGKELLNLPVTVGLIGLILAPVILAVGAVVGLAKEFTVVIERRE